MADPLDRLAHSGGEGNGLTQHFPEIEFGGLAIFGEPAVEGLDEGGLDLGSCVQFAGAGEDDGIVVGCC